MSLKDEGFRYLVNPSQDRYGWYHPSLILGMLSAGWFDCTDMPDAELEAFFKAAGD